MDYVKTYKECQFRTVGREEEAMYPIASMNRIIERGHRPLKDTLSKLGNDQVDNLLVILFVERTTVYRPTGYTPFYMVYRQEPILPIKSRFLIQRTLFIEEIIDRSKLIELRVRQFQLREEDVNEAIY